MRFSIYARLPEPAYDALLVVAEQDFRDPREQAAKFIVDALRASGALHAEERNPSNLTAAVPATVPT